MAILDGLRTQLQVDGKMVVCSVGPHFTEHDGEPVDEEDIARFYDDVKRKVLPGHLVRAARWEEIKFLNMFQVYKKVPESNAKGKERASVCWCDFNKGDSNNMAVRSHLVGRECRWKDPFMQSTFAATPPMSFIGLRPVDDDMGGNWTSHISIHQLRVNCTLLCRRKIAKPGMVGQLLRTHHGTGDAAHECDDFGNKKIAAVGFQIGKSSPCEKSAQHGTLDRLETR